ncbi:hypothetical protein [Caldimonas taiwanensis]|uniref:hypothetical protein n=1 Tax=Caldimonas taiwanensis TaxID=307483 RepID=UPI0007829204|nr:hypothetical protein [Caldimonas taiwanensis]
MALLFIDGFDHYDPQALDSFGEPWLARGKAAYLSPQATRIPGRRPSSYALRLPAGPGGGYVKNLPSVRSALIVGAAVRVAPFSNTGELPVLMGVRDTAANMTHAVGIDADGRLRALQSRNGDWFLTLARSVATAAARGWHYIEMRLVQSDYSGVFEVRLNGVSVITLYALNTLNGANGLITVFLGPPPGQETAVTIDVDDLYIADTTGTINNTFLGDVRVDVLQAQAQGTQAQWSVLPSGLQAWQAVSDGDDATAITASTVGMRHSFDMAALPVMASPAVHGVQVTMLARKTDAGNGRVRGLVISGAQSAVSADIVLEEQLAWHTAMFELNPNGNVQWTEGTLNAAEFGVEAA